MHNDDDQIIAAHAANTHRPAPHRVQQWHDAIDRAAAMERGKQPSGNVRRPRNTLFWGAAVSAALIFGVAIGSRWPASPVSPDASPPAMVNTTPKNTTTPVAFTRGLSMHLRESQESISRFDSGSNSAKLLRNIVEQNRIFEAAADKNNAENIARVLRAFEPILLRLAAEDIAPGDAEALRQQLEFELKVMLTKLAQPPSDQSHST